MGSFHYLSVSDKSLLLTTNSALTRINRCTSIQATSVATSSRSYADALSGGGSSWTPPTTSYERKSRSSPIEVSAAPPIQTKVYQDSFVGVTSVPVSTVHPHQTCSSVTYWIYHRFSSLFVHIRPIVTVDQLCSHTNQSLHFYTGLKCRHFFSLVRGCSVWRWQFMDPTYYFV
jgi:hypothetical protein